MPVETRRLKDLEQRLRVQLVQTLTADLLRLDQTGVQQDAEVRRDGGLRHVERPGEIADRQLGGTQAVQNRSPCRIGDGAKDVHGRLGGRSSHEPQESNKRSLICQA